MCNKKVFNKKVFAKHILTHSMDHVAAAAAVPDDVPTPDELFNDYIDNFQDPNTCDTNESLIDNVNEYNTCLM